MLFALTKWYVDVVADDGRTAIAYWASLRAAGARHAVAGLLRADADGRAERTFTMRGSRGPAWRGDALEWRCPALHVSVDATRGQRPFAQRLLDSPAGTLDWCCEAPSARVRMATPSGAIEGAGYVERMELGIAPWALPIERLRWGRWSGASRSLVWIRWEGRHPLQRAWLDGDLVPDALAAAAGVDLGPLGALSFEDQVVITNATVGEQLTSLAPLRRLVRRVAHHRQTRWRARGVLRAPGCDDLAGWVIHEEVEWQDGAPASLE